jgi:hypothetical protein
LAEAVVFSVKGTSSAAAVALTEMQYPLHVGVIVNAFVDDRRRNTATRRIIVGGNTI